MKYFILVAILLLVSCGSFKMVEEQGMFVDLQDVESPLKTKFKPNEKTEVTTGKYRIELTKKFLKVTNDVGYLFIDKEVPAKTKNILVMVDNYREVVKFIRNDQSYTEVYELAEKEFMNLRESPKDFKYPVFTDIVEKGIVLNGFLGQTKGKPSVSSCKSGTKKCFLNKFNRHISRYFDGSIANDLGLSSGRKRILVSFSIGEKGVTIVNIKADHPSLEKEVRQVFSKLPKIKPALKRNKPVIVKYSLPIQFVIE